MRCVVPVVVAPLSRSLLNQLLNALLHFLYFYTNTHTKRGFQLSWFCFLFVVMAVGAYILYIYINIYRWL